MVQVRVLCATPAAKLPMKAKQALVALGVDLLVSVVRIPAALSLSGGTLSVRLI